MTQRRDSRTAQCGAAEARIRLAQARTFADVAELVLDEPADTAPGVAAALAVLGGIAAADAACCAALGERSRGQDHRQAVALLRRIQLEGARMARDLGALLDVKDASHYAPVLIGVARGRGAVRRARSLIDAAERILT